MTGHTRGWSARTWIAGLLGAGAGFGCADEAHPEPVSTVLITLDTTRADALGCYDARDARTPHLDRLATEGVLYERAITVAPLTLPAHASMLTGLVPLRHTVRENALWALPESAETTAEIARAAGFQTAAFVASVVLDARFGTAQGFEVFDAPQREAARKSTHAVERRGPEVAGRAVAWLAARDRDRPFFLWMHLFDPHGPYDPPPPFRRGRTRDELYRDEVTTADAAVGRLLDALRAEGALGHTLVLVIADHGESLGEHGEDSHGAYCYQSAMRVPLLVRHPDGTDGEPGRRAGERSREIVSAVDVHPTLLDAMGLEIPEGLDGQSLYRDTVPPGRGAYFESYSGYISYGWSPLAGWIDAEGKYLHSSRPQFFDPDRDPREDHDLIEERASALEPYRSAIAATADGPVLVAVNASPSAGLLEDVRALGYAGVGATAENLPHPLAASDRPAPQARVGAHRDAVRAMELINAGRATEGQPILERILRENPGNSFAKDRLALSFIHQGEYERAVPLFREMLADGPQWAFSHYNLGLCLMELDRAEEAIESLRTAVRIDPAVGETIPVLIESLRARGRDDAAQRLEEFLESDAGQKGAGA